MSYIENLGRVKGDKGKVYVPRLKIENGRRYITWGEAVDAPTEPLEDFEITPKIYIPQLDDEGNISFILTDAVIDDNNPNAIPLSTGSGNIKGPQGIAGAVDTVIVSPGVNYEEMPEYKEEGQIYIQDGVAKVYDLQTNSFYELDNLAKFNNYYTKDDINENFYDKKTINGKIGNIERCQEAILYTLDKNKNTDENIDENIDEDTDEDNTNTESGG